MRSFGGERAKKVADVEALKRGSVQPLKRGKAGSRRADFRPLQRAKL
jgi:hypothetical protein